MTVIKTEQIFNVAAAAAAAEVAGCLSGTFLFRSLFDDMAPLPLHCVHCSFEGLFSATKISHQNTPNACTVYTISTRMIVKQYLSIIILLTLK